MQYINVSSDLKEIKQHGDYSFPYKVYPGRIPEYAYSYPLHWHEEMEIILVTYGTCSAFVNTSQYQMKQGDILIILPHQVHSFYQCENYKCEYFNILFKFSLLEDKLSNHCFNEHFKPYLDQKITLPVILHSQDPLCKRIEPYLRELISHEQDDITKYELLIRSHLLAIMYELEQVAIINKDHDNIESDTKIKSALTYIKNHYSEPITIDKIASFCNYSQSYFMKFFKHHTGSSFIQYLNNYRLELGYQLLLDSKDTVAEIALKVGFENLSYFTRSFQKKYHVTPGLVRKKGYFHDTRAPKDSYLP